MWILEDTLLWSMRVYRAVPIDVASVIELARIGSEFVGLSGYHCLRPELRVVLPEEIPLSTGTIDNEEIDDSTWDRYENTVRALEQSIWKDGRSLMQYLVAEAVMEHGTWLSLGDISESRNHLILDKSYWKSIINEVESGRSS